MFTREQRDRLRSDLLEVAAKDARVLGAAITGSAAVDATDCWSDIDLAFGVRADELDAVVADFTAWMYGRGAVDHLDVVSGPWLYRVFLRGDTLQVDLAFAPIAEFGPRAETFRLVSGTARPAQSTPRPEARRLIALGWLHALHARACIERGQPWRAEWMISGVRDHALQLACLRLDLPTAHARGYDRLPGDLLVVFRGAMVERLDPPELRRAFREATLLLVTEARFADTAHADRLVGTLTSLAGTESG